MRSLVLAACLALVACTGSTPKSDGGQKCVGELYDPCADEHSCMSGLCQVFNAAGFAACSQMCTPGSTCPPQNNTIAVTCSAAGLCQPATVNNCHL